MQTPPSPSRGVLPFMAMGLFSQLPIWWWDVFLIPTSPSFSASSCGEVKILWLVASYWGQGFAGSSPTEPDTVLMLAGSCIQSDSIYILLPKIQIPGKSEPGQNKSPNQKMSLCRTKTETSNFMFLWHLSLYKDHAKIFCWHSPTHFVTLKLPAATSPQAGFSHLCTKTPTSFIRILSRTRHFQQNATWCRKLSGWPRSTLTSFTSN